MAPELHVGYGIAAATVPEAHDFSQAPVTA
jgi:hypothetical protein